MRTSCLLRKLYHGECPIKGIEMFYGAVGGIRSAASGTSWHICQACSPLARQPLAMATRVRIPCYAWGERERGGYAPLAKIKSFAVRALRHKKRHQPKADVFFYGAVGGIRTLVPLITATRFPIVLVMTTSIPLHIERSKRKTHYSKKPREVKHNFQKIEKRWR